MEENIDYASRKGLHAAERSMKLNFLIAKDVGGLPMMIPCRQQSKHHLAIKRLLSQMSWKTRHEAREKKPISISTMIA